MKAIQKILLLIFSFLFIINNTNAQITCMPDQVFRIYAASPAVDVQLNFWAITPSGTTDSVFANITDTDYPATWVSGDHYKVSWSTNVFGAFSVAGSMTTSTGIDPNNCAQFVVEVDDTPVAPGIYHAVQKIKSAGRIDSGTDVIFRAGTEILLEGGFEVNSGAEFLAEIEPCGVVKIVGPDKK